MRGPVSPGCPGGKSPLPFDCQFLRHALVGVIMACPGVAAGCEIGREEDGLALWHLFGTANEMPFRNLAGACIRRMRSSLRSGYPPAWQRARRAAVPAAFLDPFQKFWTGHQTERRRVTQEWRRASWSSSVPKRDPDRLAHAATTRSRPARLAR